MVNRKIRSLGLDLVKDVPATVEEYNQNAKSDNACLEHAIDQYVAHSLLTEFRAAFVEAVEVETGIERATEPVLGKDGQPKKNEAGEPVLRYAAPHKTENDYFGSVLATTGRTEESFQALGQKVLDGIPFDASTPERKAAGPKKLASVYIEGAKQTFTKCTEKGIDPQQVATKIGGLIGRTVTLNGADHDANVLILAKAISDNEARKRAEAMKNAAAEYAALVQ